MVSDLPDYLQKPTFSTRQQRHTAQMEQRVDELAATLKLIQEQNASIQKAVATSTALFEEIKPSVLDLAEWRPTLEQSVADLRSDLGGVRRDLDSVIKHPALALQPTDLPPLIPRQGETSAPSARDPRPDGRRDDMITGGLRTGVVTTLVPPPVTGYLQSYDVDYMCHGCSVWTHERAYGLWVQPSKNCCTKFVHPVWLALPVTDYVELCSSFRPFQTYK
ncbi:uncharacterized protein LOC119299416 [Triticum dicoccoides]|uniref:uncharacterized protein LOC119299416 n=1 Tax=Triticum dicoccoides TaxID=85692 RepID=UPI00188FE69F|nr:uncharacterized protein LOC119299416 [Triticum dicoccoides]